VPRTARSPAPSCRLRSKGQPSCRHGHARKDKVSLPVASFVTLSGRDGTNQFECLSRSSRRPSSPAEQATTADAAKIGSLPLKENYECAQVRTCFVGAAWWPTARCAVTACAGSALPLTEKSVRKTRGGKSASTTPAKSVIWRRGSKPSEPLHFFSRRAVVSGQWPSGSGDRSPKNSCRGFAALPIGSAPTASAFSCNKHAGLPALSLQNRVGSAQVPES
jgi:hypothetical protein